MKLPTSTHQDILIHRKTKIISILCIVNNTFIVDI